MKKIFLVLSVLLFVCSASISWAQEKPSFDYYYADWCPHCKNVDEFFKESGVYEKYAVKKLNYDEPKNKIALKNLFAEKKYSGQGGIPAILIDGRILVGDNDIIAHFKNQIATKNEDFSDNNSVPLLAIIGAALVDAINPCAFAVLILLLATVINASGRRQALFSGLAFSLAIFISYFLMGLGLYKTITIFNLPKYFSIAIGILAVVLGIANLKDAIWHGKFFVMEVPFSWRPKMQTIIKSATDPLGAFGAGILVSLFLLPCTSGPYVVILGLLAERVEMAKTVALLAFYNLIFILPMLVITVGMYWGFRLGRLEEWRKTHIKLLHAIAGGILLLMGVYLIYSWI